MQNHFPTPEGPAQMGLTEEEEKLEEEHLAAVVHSMRHGYHEDCLGRMAKYFKDWRGLSEEHRALCPEYLAKLHRMVECVRANSEALNVLTGSFSDSQGGAGDPGNKALFAENARSLLRQLVREWSEEGKEERQVYEWIISKTAQHFEGGDEDPTTRSVLVPGAGLGRLAWELARRGFRVEGNEFSHFMLLPSECILNRLQHQVRIHPYIFPLSNIVDADAQLRGFAIPDVLPVFHSDSITDFGMVAGDFVHVYRQAEHVGRFDVVASSFFLDTAKNVLEYLQIIQQILKPDGLLINVGPLLYHFEGSSDEPSIELSWAELRAAISRLGFELLEEGQMQSPYVQNRLSLLHTTYTCVRTVWRKRAIKWEP